MLGVGCIVVLALAIHLLAISNYGYHGDEFYYLAGTQHLDWGYVDHPPLSVWVLGGVRAHPSGRWSGRGWAGRRRPRAPRCGAIMEV